VPETRPTTLIGRLTNRAGVTLAAGLLTVGPEWVTTAIGEAGNGLSAGAGYAWRTLAIASVLPACWLAVEFVYASAPQRSRERIVDALNSFWRTPPGHILAFSAIVGGVVTLCVAIAVSLWKDLDLPALFPAIAWEVEAGRLVSRIPWVAAVGLTLGAIVGVASWARHRKDAKPPFVIRRLGPIAIALGLLLSLVNLARPLGFYSVFHPILLVLAFWAYVLGLSLIGSSRGVGSAKRWGRLALAATPIAATVGVWLLANGLAQPSASALRILDRHRPLAAKLAVAAFSNPEAEPELACPEGAVRVAAPVSADSTIRRPDLLFVTVDALSPDHMGALGYSRNTTPNLDRLSEQGALFEGLRSTGSATRDGLAGIHFSRPFECLKGDGAHQASIFSTLEEAGYRTVAIYGYPMGHGVTKRYDASLLEPFQHREFVGADQDTPNTVSPDSGVTASALDELDSAPVGSPLAMWLHFYNPHPVYNPPGSTRGRFGSGQVARYDAEVLATDSAFGRVWEGWRSKRDGRDLVVLVTADHGQALGKLGQHGHGTSLVRSMVHVPLILAGPGVNRTNVTRSASTLDIGPTVLELLGLERPRSFLGHSLLPDLEGTRPDAPVWMTQADAAGRISSEAVVLGRYKLYREVRPKYALLYREREYFALYDISTDPDERHNLADIDPERVEHLKPLLLSRVYTASNSSTRTSGSPEQR